jgi:hypothetical protein
MLRGGDYAEPGHENLIGALSIDVGSVNEIEAEIETDGPSNRLLIIALAV